MSFGVWHVAALEKQYEKEQARFLTTPGDMERKRSQSTEKAVAPSKVMIKEANTQLMMMFEKIASLESQLDNKSKELGDVTAHYSGTSDVVQLLETRLQKCEEARLEKEQAHSSQLVSYQEQCQNQLNVMKEQCKLQIKELNDYVTSCQGENKNEMEQFKNCSVSLAHEKETLLISLAEKDTQIEDLNYNNSSITTTHQLLQIKVEESTLLLEQIRNENEVIKQKYITLQNENTALQNENTAKDKQLAVLLSTEDSILGLARLISEIKCTVSDTAVVQEDAPLVDSENICNEDVSVQEQSVAEELNEDAVGQDAADLADREGADIVPTSDTCCSHAPTSEATDAADPDLVEKADPPALDDVDTQRELEDVDTQRELDDVDTQRELDDVETHTEGAVKEELEDAELQRAMTTSSDSSYVNVMVSEVESYQDVSSIEPNSSRSRDSSNCSLGSDRHGEDCCTKEEGKVEEEVREEEEISEEQLTENDAKEAVEEQNVTETEITEERDAEETIEEKELNNKIIEDNSEDVEEPEVENVVIEDLKEGEQKVEEEKPAEANVEEETSEENVEENVALDKGEEREEPVAEEIIKEKEEPVAEEIEEKEESIAEESTEENVKPEQAMEAEEAKEDCCSGDKEGEECNQESQQIEDAGVGGKREVTAKPGFIFTTNPSVVPGSIIRTPAAERSRNRPEPNLYEDTTAALNSTVV